MAFDPTLDKDIFTETIDLQTTRITVAVKQYNEGEKKLQISRENANAEGTEWRFAKLGRLFKDEAVAVIPIMQKALEHM
ncbi:hypothetical protein ISS07_03360 [Candidatus Woesearchaeota archaeon]|nr:hypothetical protein [Candidatus Woesearchaeota archaeon]